MAVNGAGDQDPTSWTVKSPFTGKPALDSKGKPLAGLKAKEAFAEVRKARRTNGTYLVAIRT